MMADDKVKVPGEKLGLLNDKRKHTLEPHGGFWADVTGLAKKRGIDSVALYHRKGDEYKLAGYRRVSVYRQER